MAVEHTAPSSRRAILVGAVGAAVASIASALGRPSPASAVATPVYLDQNNPSSAETSIETSAVIGSVFIGSHLGSGNGLYGYSTGGNGVYGWTQAGTAAGLAGNATAASGANSGVLGHSSSTSGRGIAGRAWAGTGTTFGVHGQADSNAGYGVYGIATAASGYTIGTSGQAASTNGIGVYARANASTGQTYGVFAFNLSDTGTGVYAYVPGTSGTPRGVYGRVEAAGGTAIIGYNGIGADPVPGSGTAIYGLADRDTASRGVWGRSPAGRGVYGQASTGQGVRGYSATGSALYGSTSGPKKGAGLRVLGKARFDHCVGVKSFSAGATSVVVTPGIDLTSSSAVVATISGGSVGASVVRSAVDASADTFTIFLSGAASAPGKVAWHVFG